MARIFELQAERGEVVPPRVVQFARNSHPLGLRRALREERLRRPQFGVDPAERETPLGFPAQRMNRAHRDQLARNVDSPKIEPAHKVGVLLPKPQPDQDRLHHHPSKSGTCAEQERHLQRDGREERAWRAAVGRRHRNDQQRFDSDQQRLARPRTLSDQDRAEERRAERSEKENPDEGRRMGVGTGRHQGHRENADPDPDRDGNREDQPVKALLEPHGTSIASHGWLLACRKS